MSFQTIKLTAIDIRAIKLADSLHLTYEVDGKHTAYLVKKPTDKEKAQNPFAQDVHVSLPCGVTMGSHFKMEMSNARAREYLHLYDGCHARSVLNTLKVGDAVCFTFHPDYGSTEALRDAGFHADVLTMDVSRASKKHGEDYYERIAQFEIETRITNSRWRMIDGIVPREVTLITD